MMMIVSQSSFKCSIIMLANIFLYFPSIKNWFSIWEFTSHSFNNVSIVVSTILPWHNLIVVRGIWLSGIYRLSVLLYSIIHSDLWVSCYINNRVVSWDNNSAVKPSVWYKICSMFCAGKLHIFFIVVRILLMIIISRTSHYYAIRHLFSESLKCSHEQRSGEDILL